MLSKAEALRVIFNHIFNKLATYHSQKRRRGLALNDLR